MREHGKAPDRGRLQRVALALGALGSALAILGAFSSSALADRSFDSKIPGFSNPMSVAFDAAGNVWITDNGHATVTVNPGQNGIYKYDPYPSQTLLVTPDTHTPWGFASLETQVAVDQQNGNAYAAMANGRTLDVFEESGPFTEEWSSINGSGGVTQAGFHVAIDNSDTFSRGRIYLSLTATENYVEAVDAFKRPVDFPATASYISDNRLTGTPEGPFGEVQNVFADTKGNLYVTDIANQAVDEFDSSGTFLRRFPAVGAEVGNPGTGGVAVDPTNGDVMITGPGVVNEYDAYGNHLDTLNVEGARGTPAVNAAGYLYVPREDRIDIYTPNAVVPSVAYKPVSSPTATAGTLNATVDPNGSGAVTTCDFEYGTTTSYELGSLPCSPDPAASPPASNFTSPTDVSAAIGGLTKDTTYHYRVVVAGANGIKYGEDRTYAPHGVLGLRTDAATGVTSSEAVLNGAFVGDGTDTHYYFEWGPTAAYGKTSPNPPGNDAGSPSGPGYTTIPDQLTGLTPYSTYHYRVVATNGSGTGYGEDRMLTTEPGPPTSRGAAVTAVHADRALFHGEVDPNGADTTARVEYVPDANFQQSGWADARSAPSPEAGVGMSKHFQNFSVMVNGLEPATLYHYRVVGTNEAGSGDNEATFTTFGFIPSFNDPCANAHTRQQTGAALLLDCRAYELVSAANTGGYDVESNLVQGQTPFGGYPDAENPSQVLYGVHDGGIPGTGEPTNRGVDPYVATRGPEGWTTEYVGIPASAPSTDPFSSTLQGADAGLDTFAFSGPNICDPCFADGSSGIPIHKPDGSLSQGMAGSLSVPKPVAAGEVKTPFSADGSHFVFGSEQQFVPAGNPNDGNVTIYERDLHSGGTEVASTNAAGSTLADGDNVAELDISGNGSRVVIGDLVNTDAAGNRYYHLYAHIAGSPASVDLTPGAADGALYDGMSSDGTRVFFTTKDRLSATDTDNSADVYEVDLSAPQSPQLTEISLGAGGAGNSDSCDPAANTKRPHWNSVSAGASCDAVAIGGGGGVAKGDGTIYFLSPELLDGPSNGTADAPNLYVARPGAAPKFVRTLESSANAPLPPPSHPFIRSFGAFGNPGGVAIDRSNGDLYVADMGNTEGTFYVYKFDSEGHPIQSFGSGGKLSVSGTWGAYDLSAEIAVDNDPSSPNYRDLYVPGFLSRVVSKYDPSGNHLSDINLGFNFPAGIAVSPANGHVYISIGYFSGESVWVYGTNGAFISSIPVIHSPTSIAVDSGGNLYVTDGGGYFKPEGTLEKYDASGNDLGEFGNIGSATPFGLGVDPITDHVYVNEGTRVVELDPSGNQVGAPTGEGLLSNSYAVAADGGSLLISNPGKTNVSYYGPAALPGDPNVDSPLVIDSVGSAATRHTADFQVNTSGDDAVFTSTLPLTGYDNAAHREAFRYDAPSATLDCVSCNPTGEQATGEVSLASDGASLTDDGRVFFNSTEGLVDRDLNEKLDAYEWEEGKGIELISTGTSPYDSSLLSASADGADAFFYTRDTLVSADVNGPRVKIYDARADGGIDQAPPPHQCQASDECHGPSSAAPGPPDIQTIAGKPVGNAMKPAAKRKRHRHHRRKHHHRGHHRHGAAK